MGIKEADLGEAGYLGREGEMVAERFRGPDDGGDGWARSRTQPQNSSSAGPMGGAAGAWAMGPCDLGPNLYTSTSMRIG